MNWYVIGVILLILGPALIGLGAKHERKNNEPPQLVQYGFLSAIVGAFILLVQLFSIAAALLIFVLVTGVVWLLDKFVLAKKRGEARPSDWVEYARGFFPVILAVFLLRSFLVEPYQIPSSSMRPGLVVGDFILVNKFAYGIRMPILNNVVVQVGKPQPGDVMVFNYPEKPSIDYIKRVIGTPGDTIEYRSKKLTVNGKPVPTDSAGQLQYAEGVYLIDNQQFTEKLGEHVYNTLQMDVPEVNLAEVRDFPFRENCRYDDEGFSCKVPDGYYFMMGDNRDHSADSRYWGFVPDKYIVGKAFLVWFNFKQLNRIGTKIQ
ncbi:signal peptidase I [Jeongeupia naejangsanensis]|uniref:Signal peptidase I n=1 Tax=Jeongeupia naejangsanensis TaxID=613195 RepID=A0ABS2BIU2_9NEIS|nr:signal peptidase I [Jeongeupia naejangsanensis]MBM3115516.1 signal peptidase I [Jeongeupia naejangsanensis]